MNMKWEVTLTDLCWNVHVVIPNDVLPVNTCTSLVQENINFDQFDEF